MNVPFNVFFHGLAQFSFQESAGVLKIIKGRVIFDPLVIIRQCASIAQYFKTAAFPSSFGHIY